jgi:hypothetical protein
MDAALEPTKQKNCGRGPVSAALNERTSPNKCFQISASPPRVPLDNVFVGD